MKERRNPQPAVVRCKLVLVGEVHCGKTAMLQVLAKDCYPEVSDIMGSFYTWERAACYPLRCFVLQTFNPVPRFPSSPVTLLGCQCTGP